MLELYTDGSSTGRSNLEWGWGWVLIENGQILASDFGGGPCGTNNMGELQAAIEGLAHVYEKHKNKSVTLISDSLYTLKIASAEYTPKKNIDRCVLLHNLYKALDCGQKWVKGHSGNTWNEYADKLSKRGKSWYAAKRKVEEAQKARIEWADWPGKEGGFKY